MSRAVVDASLAVKWVIPEVHSDRAAALASSWVEAGVQPVAPYLMAVEVTNALYRRTVRGEISKSAATALLRTLLRAGIELLEPAGLHERAIELAAELEQSAAYDTHYLALAESLNCELWTADERFFRACRTLRPRVRWVGDA